MRFSLVTNAWAKRIQKLESILETRERQPIVFRFGYVRRLPGPPSGQCPIVISKSESTGLPHVERCEFEERAGAPQLENERCFHVYLNLEEENEGVP